MKLTNLVNGVIFCLYTESELKLTAYLDRILLRLPNLLISRIPRVRDFNTAGYCLNGHLVFMFIIFKSRDYFTETKF